MLPDEFCILTRSSRQLYRQHWTSSNNAEAVVVFIHGLHAHSGIITQFLPYFLKARISVIGLDLYGHGRSNGSPGYFHSVDDLVQDVHAQIESLPDSASLGGLIAINYSRKFADADLPIAGLILLSPLVYATISPNPFIVSIGKVMNLFLPKLQLPLSVESDPTPEVQKVLEEIAVDPLCYHGSLRLGSAMALRAASEEIQKTSSLQEVSVPFLLFHGRKDRVVDLKGSVALENEARSRDKTLRIVEDWGHMILELKYKEKAREEIFGEIIEWIKRRV